MINVKGPFLLLFFYTNDDDHQLSELRINLQGNSLGESELPITEAPMIKS